MKYCGVVCAEEVHDVLARYNLLIFPSWSENYGHVILEALTSGCAVLISDRTPWSRVQAEGAGTILALSSPKRWAHAIDMYARMGREEFSNVSATAKRLATAVSNDASLGMSNRQLFC